MGGDTSLYEIVPHNSKFNIKIYIKRKEQRDCAILALTKNLIKGALAVTPWIKLQFFFQSASHVRVLALVAAPVAMLLMTRVDY